jgi:hypothetical protein
MHTQGNQLPSRLRRFLNVHGMKLHGRLARQALNHAGASDANEVQAWRAFRAAVEAEGWLAE